MIGRKQLRRLVPAAECVESVQSILFTTTLERVSSFCGLPRPSLLVQLLVSIWLPQSRKALQASDQADRNNMCGKCGIEM